MHAWAGSWFLLDARVEISVVDLYGVDVGSVISVSGFLCKMAEDALL
jgi:hypothetical protein